MNENWISILLTLICLLKRSARHLCLKAWLYTTSRGWIRDVHPGGMSAGVVPISFSRPRTLSVFCAECTSATKCDLPFSFWIAGAQSSSTQSGIICLVTPGIFLELNMDSVVPCRLLILLGVLSSSPEYHHGHFLSAQRSVMAIMIFFLFKLEKKCVGGPPPPLPTTAERLPPPSKYPGAAPASMQQLMPTSKSGFSDTALWFSCK